jgi:hypothetical protein
MIKILLLLTSFTMSVERTQIWREGDVFHPFLIESETKALISKKCVESPDGCEALKAVKTKLKLNFTEAQLAGGKNPSSLLCSIGHKGEVLIFKDAKGNENSFCKFPDLSMIRANDLR